MVIVEAEHHLFVGFFQFICLIHFEWAPVNLLFEMMREEVLVDAVVVERYFPDFIVQNVKRWNWRSLNIRSVCEIQSNSIKHKGDTGEIKSNKTLAERTSNWAFRLAVAKE